MLKLAGVGLVLRGNGRGSSFLRLKEQHCHDEPVRRARIAPRKAVAA
jgi:hypothetical protein